ncbi:MAG TPA: ribonuclease H-like domain-containing protein, partial [Bryobacteraceae bacterium]|nr:ribonuclease H-like domain-containing protein [Bryobacteraceae bacterium]
VSIRRAERPRREAIEELLSGEVVRTRRGRHFETERIWERHRRYGSVGIADLADWDPDLLCALSGGEIPHAAPTKLAFLDTETTGLGAGACAFLVGVGSIDAAGFRLRQFFMRDWDEEASLLGRLAEYLEQFDALVTFNGRTFDQPLLEGRFYLYHMQHSLARMPHLDLLFGARRLWRLRLDSCRLMDLETEVLGVERQGDLPGDLIPYYYFEFQRNHQALRLVPIFHHNALDILTLACLTPIVAEAFRTPAEAAVMHGADLIGLARWLCDAKRRPEALTLLRRAVEMGLPDPLLFRTMWDIAREERRGGGTEAALEVWSDLAATRNPFRAQAMVELAKHHERRAKNYAAALEFTLQALAIGESPGLRRREERLRARLQAARLKAIR